MLALGAPTKFVSRKEVIPVIEVIVVVRHRCGAFGATQGMGRGRRRSRQEEKEEP